MRIGLGTLGAVSFLDCDMQEGKELAFVTTWVETRTIG